MRGYAVAAVVVLAVAGCGGATKTGGGGGRRVHLAIANHEDRDLTDYIAAVERLSHGSITLAQRTNWRSDNVDYDRGTVADVRKGKVAMAKVAVRSLHELGVRAFDAISAPFLVDGLSLEQRVLGSRLADEMLPALRRLGVEGVAMLPGQIRRPFALKGRLVAPADFRRAVIGIRPSFVSAETFRALGARPRAYLPGELPPWTFKGAELDLVTLDGNHYDLPHSTMTSNVAFWPKPFVVIVNRAVYSKLSDAQRDALRRAGREALAPAVDGLRREDASEAVMLCKRRLMSFVRATRRQAAELRAAVQPVYSRLERDPTTRSAIAAISAMKRTSPTPDAPGCSSSSAATAKATPLDGTWVMTAAVSTVARESDVPPAEARIDAGRYRLVLRRGRVVMTHVSPPRWGGQPGGRFTLGPSFTVTFHFSDGDSTYRWSVYHDTLRLEPAPGRGGGAPNATYAPWHRVRP